MDANDRITKIKKSSVGEYKIKGFRRVKYLLGLATEKSPYIKNLL